MKELRIQHRADLPNDFLQKFWIRPDDFQSFLALLREHDLFFSVEIPDESLDNRAAIAAINEELDGVQLRGGPRLPAAEGEVGGPIRRWELVLLGPAPAERA
jgi:hypothetical protein